MFLDVHIIDEQDVLVGSSLPDLPVVCPGIEPRPPSIEPFLFRHNAAVGFLARRFVALERVVPLPVIQVPAAPELDVFEPPLNPFAFSLEEFDGCLRILLFSSDFVDHPDVAVAILIQKVQILSGEESGQIIYHGAMSNLHIHVTLEPEPKIEASHTQLVLFLDVYPLAPCCEGYHPHPPFLWSKVRPAVMTSDYHDSLPFQIV